MERNWIAGRTAATDPAGEQAFWPTSLAGWGALFLAWLAMVALAALHSGVLPGAGNRHSAHWYPWEQSWVWLAVGAVGALCAGTALLQNDRALGTVASAVLGTLAVALLVVTLAM